MYHINPATGEPGQCRARYDCPFGDLEKAHYETADQARVAFEETQETFPSKKKRVGVFRVGPLEPQAIHFDDLQELLEDFEATTPEGRQGRAGALFASPDLESHSRWVLGVSERNLESHELSVDPERVYVYPIDTYERASHAQSHKRMDEFKELAQEYWDSGMTLADWRAWSTQAKPASGSWEVLIPPTEMLGSKPVSNKRVIEHSDPKRRSQLNWRLEPRRASKGLVWGKEDSEAD